MRRLLVLLYPRTWRQRYAAEFLALLEQEALTPGELLDIVRGALDAHRLHLAQRSQAVHTGVASGISRRKSRERREWQVDRERDAMRCSFCGKSQNQVSRLIAGPHVYVCDECVGRCNQILADYGAKPPAAARHRAWRRWRARAWHACRGVLRLPGSILLDRGWTRYGRTQALALAGIVVEDPRQVPAKR